MRKPFLCNLNEMADKVDVPAWQFTYALEAFADFFDPLRIYLFGSRIAVNGCNFSKQIRPSW